MSLKNKLIAGGAGAALLLAGVGIAVGASSNNGEKPPEATSSSAPATPTPEATETPTATPTPEAPAVPENYDFGLTEADVAGLLSADFNTVNNMTLQEKAVLALYYAQDLPEFADQWHSVSKNPLDVMPATINVDNTPEEIMTVTTMSVRQAMTLTDSDGFFLDKEASDKLIAASLINGSLSQAYESLTRFSSQFIDRSAPSARTLAVSKYLDMPVINSHSEKYTDAAGYTCIDFNSTQKLLGDVEPVTADSTACLVTVGGGSLWMQR